MKRFFKGLLKTIVAFAILAAILFAVNFDKFKSYGVKKKVDDTKVIENR